VYVARVHALPSPFTIPKMGLPHASHGFCGRVGLPRGKCEAIISREAAIECSPRRKSWDDQHNDEASPEGAKETPADTGIVRRS